MEYNANTIKPPKMRAGIDFTHCERGWCSHCSREQQLDCEYALEAEEYQRQIKREAETKS